MTSLIDMYNLTPSQNKLVLAYLSNGFNKAKAARTAGVSVQLFNDDKVQRAVADQMRTILANCQFQAVAFIDRLSQVAMADLKDYMEPCGPGRYRVKADIPPDMMYAISELKTDKDGITTVKLHSYKEAGELLLKAMKIISDDNAIVNNVYVGDDAANVIDNDELKKELAFEMRRYIENIKQPDAAIDMELTDGESDNDYN